MLNPPAPSTAPRSPSPAPPPPFRPTTCTALNLYASPGHFPELPIPYAHLFAPGDMFELFLSARRALLLGDMSGEDPECLAVINSCILLIIHLTRIRRQHMRAPTKC